MLGKLAYFSTRAVESVALSGLEVDFEEIDEKRFSASRSSWLFNLAIFVVYAKKPESNREVRVFIVHFTQEGIHSVLPHIGGCKGEHEGRTPPPPPPGRQNSVIFTQVLGEFGKIVCSCPPRKSTVENFGALKRSISSLN